MLKKFINLIIRERDPTISEVKNDEIENGNSSERTDEINKILAKSKNINKLLKVKKFAKT